MLKFFIEQIAIYPRYPVEALELLKDMGATRWVNDHVKATGEVYGKAGSNEADLAFNYDMGMNDTKPLEFEVLNYTDGEHWMGNVPHSVSHLGMHCSAEDLVKWRAFFADRGISVAQEVMTTEHSNPAIAGQRWYNYVIFATRSILGVNIKFIVRLAAPGTAT